MTSENIYRIEITETNEPAESRFVPIPHLHLMPPLGSSWKFRAMVSIDDLYEVVHES